jgi:lysosomal Pro-X carboxypeptidase
MYTEAAQFNIPPEYPVNKICNAIDQASFGNDILDKIYSGLVSFFGNQTCKDANPTYSSKINMGWGWQVVYIISFTKYILLYSIFKYTLSNWNYRNNMICCLYNSEMLRNGDTRRHRK